MELSSTALVITLIAETVVTLGAFGSGIWYASRFKTNVIQRLDQGEKSRTRLHGKTDNLQADVTEIDGRIIRIETHLEGKANGLPVK